MLSSLRPLRALSRTVPLSAHPPRPRAPTSLHVARPARPFSSSSKRTASKYVRFGGDSKQTTNVWRFDLREKIVVGIVVAGGWYYVAHLEQIEDTGRWRFMDVSPQLEAKLARASHEALVAEYGRKVLPPNHPLTRHVRRVVERILEASNLGTLTPPEPAHALPFGEPDGGLWHPAPAGHKSGVPPTVGGKQWNLMVVNDDREVNAAASFGDIIVFTGILRAARDEEGLAAVLGHEIGHAVLRHMSERVSSAKVLLIIASTFSMLGLEFGLSQMVSRLVYELPNSRMHELEADKVGLRLMSRACYDPQAAPAMFTRLAKLEGAGSRFQFLSTHPATEQRIEKLETLLPDAYAIRAASPECAGLNDSYSAFRDAVSHGGRRGAPESEAVWGW
ncbi:peptidase family M48-domain-containing protein [Rhodofomes roseus]|uniref:Peptidase family M48-domain-containing protein n=1 Tax=Rhodofomes roseus TaxID=34475 RepID=A0ABQ8KQB5_9APHY|nr:peptidase family M48-domain-containing protein [Rhodofomes roseus]KAH9840613.1 peptidase family M48-domain-containing protein [Rhodofomes roseus]